MRDERKPSELRPLRRAILCGVSSYGPRYGELLQVPDELKDLKNVLKNQLHEDYRYDQVDILSNEDLTLSLVFRLLDELATESPVDEVFLLLAGHATRFRGQDYFVTYGASSGEYPGIRFDDLARGITKIAAKKRIVILDFCLSGAVLDSFDGPKTKGLSILAAGRSEEKAAAGLPGQISLTRALIRSIKETPSDAAGIIRWHAIADQSAEIINRNVLQTPVFQSDRELWRHPVNKIAVKHKPIRIRELESAPSANAPFFGRKKELKTGIDSILKEKCRILAFLGAGAVGKSTLAARIAKAVDNSFEVIVWKDLKNDLPFNELVQHFNRILPGSSPGSSKDTETEVQVLIAALESQRTLLILDNLESLLEKEAKVGTFRAGYEQYRAFLNAIANTENEGSCIIVTSRESPDPVESNQSADGPVKRVILTGLGGTAAKQLLKEGGIPWSVSAAKLVEFYAGNPLALRFACRAIQLIHDGSIDKFLESQPVFGEIRNVIGETIGRLSFLEKRLVRILAVEREPVAIASLQDTMTFDGERNAIPDALVALRQRFTIEENSGHFTLQNVILEYVTETIITGMAHEIQNGDRTSDDFLGTVFIIKAEALDHIRESQHRMILLPLLQRLANTGILPLTLEERLVEILHKDRLRTSHYLAGNIANLMIAQGFSFKNCDFSGRSVRQADFRGAIVRHVNFSQCNLRSSTFTDYYYSVYAVDLDCQHQRIAIGTGNGEVYLVNYRTGVAERTVFGHGGWVRSVQFSPDGALLVVGYSNGAVSLCRVEDGVAEPLPSPHAKQVRSVSFHPNGTCVASAGEDGVLKIRSICDGKVLWEIKCGHGEIWAAVYSPDGSYIATAGDDGALAIWETNGYTLQWRKGAHSERICDLVFSPDGRKAATASHDRTVRLWDIESREVTAVLEGHADSIWGIAFDRTGSKLLSGSYDETIRVWEIAGATARPFSILPLKKGQVWPIRRARDGSVLASVSGNEVVQLWSGDDLSQQRTILGSSNKVWDVDFSSDGKGLVSAHSDHSIRIWNVEAATEITQPLRGHTGGARSARFLFNNGGVISGGEDTTVRFWQTLSGERQTIRAHKNWVWRVAAAANADLAVSGSGDHQAIVWNTRERAVHCVLQGHKNRIRTVAISHDGKLAATASDDSTVRVWQTSMGQCLHEFSFGGGLGLATAFSPDGNYLIAASNKSLVKVWRLNPGAFVEILSISPKNRTACCAAFSADQKSLILGHTDGSIALYDFPGTEARAIYPAHTSSITSISAAGQFFATGSEDQSIGIWALPLGRLEKRLTVARPYEGMNITGAHGLTEAQRRSLRALGALDNSEAKE